MNEKDKKTNAYWMWRIIYDDVCTLFALSKNHDSAVALASLPFYSFFVYEVLSQLAFEYSDKEYVNLIKQYRNSLKIFTDKFTPAEHKMSAVRNQHDEYFRNRLRFSFTKHLDINYDLGIYFDNKGQIIHNTQMASGLSLNQYEDPKENMFQFGRKTGEIIADIKCELEQHFGKEEVRLRQMVSGSRYLDINTSREKQIFNLENSLDLNMYLLHMYSWLGYVRNVLCAELDPDNSWLIRMKFIAVFNIERGLNTVNRYYSVNGPKPKLVEKINAAKDNWKINRYNQLRNCMMHYGLYQNGICLLTDENAKQHVPLYGLIENCTSIETNSFLEILNIEMNDLYGIIGKEFSFDKRNLKYF